MERQKVNKANNLLAKIHEQKELLKNYKINLDNINKELEKSPTLLIRLDRYHKGNFIGGKIRATIVRSGLIDRINEINYTIRKLEIEFKEL